MISQCKNPDCGRPYWRYRADFPPRGFCSVTCKDVHARRHPPYEPERIPGFFVSLIKEHLERAHHTSDINSWFQCSECERLAAAYAASLSQHVEA